MSTSTRYILRMVLFVAKIIVAVGLLAYLVWFCLFGGLALANTFIITTDGLKARAQTVLLGKDEEVLEKFYTTQFLQDDRLLIANPYAGLKIATYDHDVIVKGVKVGAGSDTAVIKVEETISSILPAKTQEAQAAIPDWKNNTYNVKLKKQEDKMWKIDAMEILSVADENKQDVVVIQ